MLRCKRSGHVGNMFDLICCYLCCKPQPVADHFRNSLRRPEGGASRADARGSYCWKTLTEVFGRICWNVCAKRPFRLWNLDNVHSMDELCIWSSVSFSSNLWIPKPSKPRASSFHLPPLGHQGLRQSIPDTSQVHKVAARWGSFR